MKVSMLFLCVALFACVWSATGQQQIPGQIRENEKLRREAEQREVNNRFREMELLERRRRILLTAKNNVPPPVRQFNITEEDKKYLESDADLKAKHARFLKLSKTGLIKLAPDIGCNYSELIVDAREKCLQNSIPGGGAYYSFRRSKYVLPTIADLRFYENRFSVAGRIAGGVMVALGDIPLEQLNSKSDGVKFLTDLVPATIRSKANEQMTEFQNGLRKDNYIYTRILPLNNKTVYAMRIIAYQPDEFSVNLKSTKDLYDFIQLEDDKRSDIIMAFRIVEINNDGSIWILWRELSRLDAPKLIFTEPKKK